MLKRRRQIIVATICLSLALTQISALATQDPPQSPPAKIDFKFEKVDLDLLEQVKEVRQGVNPARKSACKSR
jgi:hypothetical protein